MNVRVDPTTVLEERAWQIREGIFENVREAIDHLFRVLDDAEKGQDASLHVNLSHAISAVVTAGENDVVLKKLGPKIGGPNG